MDFHKAHFSHQLLLGLVIVVPLPAVLCWTKGIGRKNPTWTKRVESAGVTCLPWGGVVFVAWDVFLCLILYVFFVCLDCWIMGFVTIVLSSSFCYHSEEMVVALLKTDEVGGVD